MSLISGKKESKRKTTEGYEKGTIGRMIREGAEVQRIKEKLKRGEKLTTQELLCLTDYQAKQSKMNKKLDQAVSNVCKRHLNEARQVK